MSSDDDNALRDSLLQDVKTKLSVYEPTEDFDFNIKNKNIGFVHVDVLRGYDLTKLNKVLETEARFIDPECRPEDKIKRVVFMTDNMVDYADSVYGADQFKADLGEDFDYEYYFNQHVPPLSVAYVELADGTKKLVQYYFFYKKNENHGGKRKKPTKKRRNNRRRMTRRYRKKR
jgi:hypothetical protein